MITRPKPAIGRWLIFHVCIEMGFVKMSWHEDANTNQGLVKRLGQRPVCLHLVATAWISHNENCLV